MTELIIIKRLHEAVAQSKHTKSDKAIMTEWLDVKKLIIINTKLEKKLGLSK